MQPSFQSSPETIEGTPSPAQWAELQSQVDRYRMLVEHGNDAVVVIQDGMFRFANPKTSEILGYSAAELATISYLDIVADEDRELVMRRHLERMQGHDVPSRYAFRIVRRDGTQLYTEISSVAVNWDGRPATLCYLRDISEQQKAEAALGASEARIQAILDNTTSVVYVKDCEGRYLLINRRFEQLFGVNKYEVIGKTDFDLWSPAMAETFRANDRRVLASGVPEQIEEEAPHDDGPHTYLSNKFPLHDTTGQVYALCGISADITDRIRAESERRRTEARNRAIIDASPDMLFVVDRIGTCLLAKANPEYLGIDPATIVGTRLTQYFSGELSARFLATIGRTLDRGMQTFEQRLPTPRGLLHFECRVVPYGENEVLFIVRDVNDRKQFEADLKEAKTAAETANHARGQFLATMSHELRTPMNGIIGMTELALADTPAGTQRGYLDAVLQSAEFMLSMINTLLDFSKIEAARVELENRPFQLREGLADTIHTLAVRAHTQGLELLCHVARDVPESLVGDLGRLKQIVFNLVGNAIKFTGTGEVTVHVTMRSRTASEVELQLSVADTGIGIASEKHHLIFEPFRQVDGSVTRKFGGTGLGLAICAELVKLMQGTIWVESAPNRGSTFHFTARFGLPESATAELPPAPSPLAGLHALVVEPFQVSRQALADMLADGRAQTVVESSASAAIEHLGSPRSASAVDLAIIDAAVGLDEVGRLLSALPKSCPALVLLRHTDQSQRAQLEKVSTRVGFLTKPVMPADLDRAAEALLASDRDVSASEGSDQLAAPRWSTALVALRVLVADDNAINQRVAAAMLTARGHHVTCASDGREALDQIARNTFDVVLMDVEMPRLDGLQATAEIRRRESKRGVHLPIVAMTAHAQADDRRRCFAAGMDGYVSKPIRPRELFGEIERFAATAPEHASASNSAAHASTTAGTLPNTLDAAAPREAATATVGVADYAHALASVGGDRALLKQLIDLYLEDGPATTAELGAALDAAEPARVYHTAHRLKNSLVYFGAGGPLESVKLLETAARAGHLDEARQLFDQLASELDRLHVQLDAWRLAVPNT